LEEFHGTDMQYDKLKRAQEAEAEKKAAEEKEAEEPEIQTPLGFSPVDFLGGVKPDTEIEDGVTAKDAAKFVFSNTMRYIPKFVSLKSKKISWNFMAFFFPSGWFLSRKMYKNGIIAGVFEIIATLLTIPFQNTCINIGVTPMTTQSEQLKIMAENMDKFSDGVLFAVLAGALLAIALKVLSALFGDLLYKKYVVESVKKINRDSENKALDYRKKGGVNLFLFLIGTMAISYIPVILALFI
jgi:hypothetical protein